MLGGGRYLSAFIHSLGVGYLKIIAIFVDFHSRIVYRHLLSSETPTLCNKDVLGCGYNALTCSETNEPCDSSNAR